MGSFVTMQIQERERDTTSEQTRGPASNIYIYISSTILRNRPLHMSQFKLFSWNCRSLPPTAQGHFSQDASYRSVTVSSHQFAKIQGTKTDIKRWLTVLHKSLLTKTLAHGLCQAQDSPLVAVFYPQYSNAPPTVTNCLFFSFYGV